MQSFLFRSVLFAMAVLATAFHAAGAEDTLCARVVIQIEQELTLEREGFEARLGITNGLPSSLDDFRVTLRFSDADGNPVAVSTDAAPNPNGKFYYRVQTGYTLPSSVPAGAAQKVAYLLVPASGSAGSTAQGQLYYVGATIRYKVAGVEQVVELAPDFITVRPMPQLQLQYFLPGDVYGDDPLTTGVVEPIVPFSLGVRVSNHSAFATAKQVKIQSGQPEIIDNQLGLLIQFAIVGCQANGSPVQPSLLVNFGDISPQRSSVANWLMTSSLSGKFIKFTAEVSHAAEFGGALTSLIPPEAISTQRLIGQVLVDLAGRDAILDFLGCDSMTGDISFPKVYESDTDQVSTAVDYFGPGNGAVTLSSGSGTATLAINATSSMLYARMASPISADKVVRAVRTDGKVLPASNAWISKNKNNNLQWEYWLNIFDTGKQAGQTYALTFTDAPIANRAPVLAISGGQSRQIAVGQTFTLPISATDPDGTIPLLSTGALPDGATFTDAHTGSGSFQWTPRTDQLGTYSVQFRASDGALTDTKSVTIQVLTTVIPTFASWQSRYWPGVTDQNIIGLTADPDRDRIVNLLEYALDGDPTVPDESILPVVTSELIGSQHFLALSYRKRTDDATLRYEVVGSDNPAAPIASWTVQTELMTVGQENLSPGFQRIKVRDSVALETATGPRYLRLRVTQTGN